MLLQSSLMTCNTMISLPAMSAAERGVVGAMEVGVAGVVEVGVT